MRIKRRKWTSPFLAKYEGFYLDDNNVDSNLFTDIFTSETLFVEIGMGKGDFIVELATQNPGIFFLGVEKNATVASIALRKVLTANLTNVLIAIMDIEKLLPKFPDGKVDRIYLNFSDPWPKKRHEKRRLTHPRFIRQYERILKKDGQVCLKTDNVDFFMYSLSNFHNMGWKLPYTSFSYNGKAKLDAMTEYERNYRKDGLNINRLVAKKGDSTNAPK